VNQSKAAKIAKGAGPQTTTDKEEMLGDFKRIQEPTNKSNDQSSNIDPVP